MRPFTTRTAWARKPALLLALLLAASALVGCSPAAVLDQVEPFLLKPPSGILEQAAGNQLLVLGVDGNVFTMDPNGRNLFALTTDASPTRQYQQPTWSPDAQRIAWTAMDFVDGQVKAGLETTRYDGSERARLDVPFAPFYIFWSPDGARLAYLSNWSENGLALRVVDASGAGSSGPQLEAKTVAEGQPLYFSWAPDGQRLLTHIGNEAIALQPIDGQPQPLQSSEAVFPAPVWSSDGQQHIYAVSDDGAQELVAASIDGASLTSITDFDGRISFTLSPDSDRLAYVVTDARIGLPTLGSLYVVDLATNGTREVSAQPVIAYFWSPDSQKLAYLAATLERDALQLRWTVWDGKRSTPYAVTQPTPTFLQNYLAFFDQYAQSMTVWAPDSQAFTYAGANRDGLAGIWVQELGEGKEARWVGSGVFASWSPR